MYKLKLIGLLAAIGLSGCLSSNYYVLSTASEPSKTYKYTPMVIGVEKVIVPKYLFKREIAVAQSASKVSFLNTGTWAEDLDDGLTHRLIAYFQKKFNQPNVHEYPWDVSKQPTKKVKLQVTRFIAQGDSVYLDATWEVENMKTGRIIAQLFSTMIPAKSNANDIVESMDKAFGQLEEVIAIGIKSVR